MRLERAKQIVLEELLAPIPNPEKEAREEDTQEEASLQLISLLQGSCTNSVAGDDDETTGFIRFEGLDAGQEFEDFMDAGLY